MTTETPDKPGPLAGLTVLDMSRVLAGPWAGQLLADLGADVIKIERPVSGDDTRGWGPPFLKDLEGRDTSEAAYYLCANRGKKSVAIDIANPKGQELVRALAERSDILLENYKVGGLAKYGLDYDSLSALNEGLIYCSITGFGQTGPYKDRPGYDVLIQAMGGLMSITGSPEAPQKVGVAVADLMTGMYATVAVLSALEVRHRTGRGQYIDLALLDVQAAFLANQNQYFLTTGDSPPRLGTAHPTIVPYQVFETADGFMILAVGNDHQFARFCEATGAAELGHDDRFSTNAGRVRYREVLVPRIAEILKRDSTGHWIELLEEHHVPCGPINDVAGVYRDPQILHRGMRVTAPHPLAGAVDMVGCPIRFGGAPLPVGAAPPTLGQHTDEVLAKTLGLEDAEIARLRKRRSIG